MNIKSQCVAFAFAFAASSYAQAQLKETTTVPRQIQFTSSFQQTRPGAVSATFSIFRQPHDGSPIWSEAQNILPEKDGSYTVHLGATRNEGIPVDLFSTAEPRWLEVEIDQVKQPRVLLSSVPYALRAADADTLGGLPASAFLMAATGATSAAVPRTGTAPSAATGNAQTGAVLTSPNYLPLINTNLDFVNSAMYQPNGTTVSIGGTTALGALTLIGNVPSGDTAGMALYNQGGGAGASVSLDMYNTFFNGGIPQARIKALDDGAYSDHLTFWTKVPGAPNNSVAERLRITSTGSVGIGTTTPSQRLEVAGVGKFSGGIMFGDGSTQTTASFGGSSGGGTITAVNAGTALTGGGTSGAVTLNVNLNQIPTLGGANFFGSTQTIGGNLNVIGAVGVGLGGAVPAQSLEVKGNLQVDGGIIYGANGTVLLSGPSSISSGGVFVGTPPPPSNAGQNNTGVGSSAGNGGTGSDNSGFGSGANGSNKTGSGNTAIGSQANFSNTNGNLNTAVGKSSMFANTTGSSNTALGGLSLATNTTGSFNAGVGHLALTLNTTGSSNSALGYNALATNTTGGFNAGFGANALSTNSTGNYNSAFGFNALPLNSTAFYNSAMGYQALNVNTTGDYNTGIGESALTANTTGTQNTALGAAALFVNTTGNYNTALGTSALDNVTAGSSNIAIGQAAGGNLTSGGQNIYIGTRGGSAVESNTIRIGTPGNQAAAYIAGVYTSGVNGLLVAVDSTGRLGFTASSRRYKKDIQDMGDSTAGLMRLRPVTYRYKQPFADGSEPIQYGLIAEEVAEVYPEMVARSSDGQIETVRYQLLDSMLLNEVQRLHKRDAAQQEQNKLQQQKIRMLEERLARLESMLDRGISVAAK